MTQDCKKTRWLRHPKRDGGEANVVGFYIDENTGRNIGQVLLFPDAYRVSLTYREIAALEAEMEAEHA